MVINICVDQKKTCVYVYVLNRVQLFSTSWTVALQAPLSMGFSRQEYWGGLLFPSPKDLSDPGIKPTSPALPALAGRFLTTEPPGKPGKMLILAWIYQLLRIWGTLWCFTYTYYQCIISRSKQKMERKAQFECKDFIIELDDKALCFLKNMTNIFGCAKRMRYASISPY